MKFISHLLLLPFLLFYQVVINAQIGDTIFYDGNWEKTTKENAKYFSLTEIIDDSNHIVRDYFISGEIQMTGHYTNGKETGRWTWYYLDGSIQQDFQYLEDGTKFWYWLDEESLKPDQFGVYHSANIFPSYGKSPTDLQDYFKANYKLPTKAKQAGITSFVAYITVTTDETGKVIQCVPYEIIGNTIDESVMDLLLNMPSWNPAVIRNEKVKFSYVIRLTYE
jgi:antitoxin component YwqK of YwqJK toxin-antitoxin module